jgi:hypothetical protein
VRAWNSETEKLSHSQRSVRRPFSVRCCSAEFGAVLGGLAHTATDCHAARYWAPSASRPKDLGVRPKVRRGLRVPRLAQAGGMEGRGGAPPIARSSDNLLCSPSRRARFTSCSRAPGALARKADANLRAAGVCLPSEALQ